MLIPSHLENVSDDDSDVLEITFANETIQINPIQPCDGRLEMSGIMIKSFE